MLYVNKGLQSTVTWQHRKAMNERFTLEHNNDNMTAGLEKVPISPWLVILLHICGFIPTPQSPETLREHWYLHAVVPMSLHLAPKLSHRMASVWVLPDVSQCFKSGSRCFTMFHDASQCFTSVSWCFTMFNNVLRCLVSRTTIGIADRLRDRQ